MIKVENLKAKYGNDEELKIIIDDLNLEIEKGSFLAVLGHNGCGKSTLAKHFNGIMLPFSGRVTVEDLDTSDDEHIYNIRQKTGMVFQNPDNQMVSSIVEDDVAFAPENLGIPREEIRKRVDFALKSVGMYEHRYKTPQALSGGQKQRVAIAGIIAMQPDYIVLDEPTAMLDPKGREEVLQTILKLNKENGITVVLITHFMSEAALADRIIVMDKGKIAMEGTPKEVFAKKEKLTSLGLSVPQSAMLLHALKEKGIDIGSDAITVEECVSDILSFFKERGMLNDRT